MIAKFTFELRIRTKCIMGNSCYLFIKRIENEVRVQGPADQLKPLIRIRNAAK